MRWALLLLLWSRDLREGGVVLPVCLGLLLLLSCFLFLACPCPRGVGKKAPVVNSVRTALLRSSSPPCLAHAKFCARHRGFFASLPYHVLLESSPRSPPPRGLSTGRPLHRPRRRWPVFSSSFFCSVPPLLGLRAEGGGRAVLIAPALTAHATTAHAVGRGGAGQVRPSRPPMIWGPGTPADEKTTPPLRASRRVESGPGGSRARRRLAASSGPAVSRGTRVS